MKLLFLCTGNSCRSQMAEGFAHARSDVREDTDLTVISAGIAAHGLNPRAVSAMAESGIDISGQQSDIFTPGLLTDGDWVVTVCDHAKASCPILPVTIRQWHWSFDDPAQATGTEKEIMSVFLRVRDEIRGKVEELFDSLLVRSQTATRHSPCS